MLNGQFSATGAAACTTFGLNISVFPEFNRHTVGLNTDNFGGLQRII